MRDPTSSRAGTEAERGKTGSTDNWDDLVLGSIGFAPELMTDDADYDQLCSACSSAASSPRKHYDPDARHAGLEVDGIDIVRDLGEGGEQEGEADGAGGAGMTAQSDAGFGGAEEWKGKQVLTHASGESAADHDAKAAIPGAASAGAASSSPGLPASASDSEKKRRAQEKRALFLMREAKQAAAELRADESALGQRTAVVSVWAGASQNVLAPGATPRAHELESSLASEQKRVSELRQREQGGIAGPRASPARASGQIQSSGGGALVRCVMCNVCCVMYNVSMVLCDVGCMNHSALARAKSVLSFVFVRLPFNTVASGSEICCAQHARAHTYTHKHKHKRAHTDALPRIGFIFVLLEISSHTVRSD